ncbi:MAG: globin domain-containing protein [Pseudomonadota bacterium]
MVIRVHAKTGLTMALSAVQIVTIRATWAKIVPVAPMAARLFYGRLFRIAPETRALFAEDMKAQGSKLTATLGFVVDHLDRAEILAPAARDLAIRHVNYSVTADQYAPVGEALIWSLKELLGPAFGEGEKAAWLAAYTSLSEMMIEAAYGGSSQDRSA